MDTDDGTRRTAITPGAGRKNRKKNWPPKMKSLPNKISGLKIWCRRFCRPERNCLVPPLKHRKNLNGQLSLFETTQELAKALFGEQQKITVPSHTRKARQPGVRQEMLAGLPKEIEEYIIGPDDSCFKCGGDLTVIGKRIVRTEVTYEPAKLKVKQIVQQIAKCTRCGKEGSENPKDHFQKAAVPVPVLPHSIATPSLVTQVMYQKFAMGMPFARQEKRLVPVGTDSIPIKYGQLDQPLPAKNG